MKKNSGASGKNGKISPRNQNSKKAETAAMMMPVNDDSMLGWDVILAMNLNKINEFLKEIFEYSYNGTLGPSTANITAHSCTILPSAKGGNLVDVVIPVSGSIIIKRTFQLSDNSGKNTVFVLTTSLKKLSFAIRQSQKIQDGFDIILYLSGSDYIDANHPKDSEFYQFSIQSSPMTKEYCDALVADLNIGALVYLTQYIEYPPVIHSFKMDYSTTLKGYLYDFLQKNCLIDFAFIADPVSPGNGNLAILINQGFEHGSIYLDHLLIPEDQCTAVWIANKLFIDELRSVVAMAFNAMIPYLANLKMKVPANFVPLNFPNLFDPASIIKAFTSLLEDMLILILKVFEAFGCSFNINSITFPNGFDFEKWLTVTQQSNGLYQINIPAGDTIWFNVDSGLVSDSRITAITVYVDPSTRSLFIHLGLAIQVLKVASKNINISKWVQLVIKDGTITTLDAIPPQGDSVIGNKSYTFSEALTKYFDINAINFYDNVVANVTPKVKLIPQNLTVKFKHKQYMAYMNWINRVHNLPHDDQRDWYYEENQVRLAAYYLWEKNGRKNGNDLADWYNAEQTVLNLT